MSKKQAGSSKSSRADSNDSTDCVELASMFNKLRIKDRKIFWMEAGFLVFLSFAITLISDLEYSAYEEHDVSRFSNDIGYRTITNFFSLICCSIYYWGFLKRYVFERRIVGIIVSSIGFVIVNRLVYKYIGNWVIVHSNIVSESLRKDALKDLHQTRFIISFNYPLISSILPLTGLAFLVRSLAQETQMKVLKEQQLLSELNYLKAQLHPHFFFNTINNIYSLALKQSTHTAPMIARLGEMMRYILYEADHKTVLFSKEIEFLSNYIAVEKLRYSQNTQIQFDVQGICPNHRIEPLLLLPFIENAFKHGLEQETTTGYVRIIICQTEVELMLDVTNSKPDAIAGKTEKGVGLQNVGKRLAILYPGKYQLEVHDKADDYQAILTIQTL